MCVVAGSNRGIGLTAFETDEIILEKDMAIVELDEPFLELAEAKAIEAEALDTSLAATTMDLAAAHVTTSSKATHVVPPPAVPGAFMALCGVDNNGQCNGLLLHTQ